MTFCNVFTNNYYAAPDLHARGKPSTMFTARGTRRAFSCSVSRMRNRHLSVCKIHACMFASHAKWQKNMEFHRNLMFLFRRAKINPRHSVLPQASPEASRKLPRSFLEAFEKNGKFVKISIFCDHDPDLCFGMDFSQGIESKQRMHFWIGLDLILEGKLVRSQLNTQILSYDHFSVQKIQKILGQVVARFPVSPNYSRAEKALRVIPRGKQWLTVYRAPQVVQQLWRGNS